MERKGENEEVSSLYDINTQIEELTNKLVDEETGEINEEIFEQLEQLDMDKKEKIENYGIVIKNIKGEIEALDSEIKSLTERKKAKTNKMNRMMDYAKYSLNGDTLETSKVAFGYKKGESVDVIDEEIVPDDYCKFETTRKPMKTEIKKAIKGGKKVPGCVLIVENHLQVK